MARDRCDFEPVCKRADIHMRSSFKYWPRDERLKPYCRGEEDFELCRIHSYWRSHPETRENMKKMPDEKFYLFPGASGLGSGVLVGLSGGYVFGSMCGALGLPLFLSGLSRTFGKKELIKFIRDFRKRDGIDDIYEAILERTEESENEYDMFWDETGETLAEKLSIIGDFSIIPADVKARETESTSFQLAKLRASYLLTDDFNLQAEEDIGVALSYEYVPFLPRPVKEHVNTDEISEAHYVTGILSPRIAGRRLRDGHAFIEGTQYVPAGIGVMQSRNEEGGVQTGIDTLITKNSGLSVDQVRKIFGDDEFFDKMSGACMDDKTTINARNIHRLMQDVLYSEFPKK